MPVNQIRKSPSRRLRVPSTSFAARSKTTADRIYGELRKDIVLLKLAPEQPINEKEVALRYGVSRTPVREALLRLAVEGLVFIFPQSGTFVGRIPIDGLPEAILIRKALEDLTVRQAAKNAEDEMIEKLREIIDRQQVLEHRAQYDQFLAADEKFHAAIAEAAGFPGVWRLVEQIKVQIDRYRRLTLPVPGRMGRVVQEHSAVVEGIARRDPERAAAAMSLHLDGLSASLTDMRNRNPEFFAVTSRNQR